MKTWFLFLFYFLLYNFFFDPLFFAFLQQFTAGENLKVAGDIILFLFWSDTWCLYNKNLFLKFETKRKNGPFPFSQNCYSQTGWHIFYFFL